MGFTDNRSYERKNYNNLPPREISARFFIMILASFFMETQPDSNIPKPKRKKYETRRITP